MGVNSSGVGGGPYNPSDWDQLQIIHVGKHGNDVNDGRNEGPAKLTFAGARAQVVANGDAAANNRYVLWCKDAGQYDEDLVGLAFTDIWAPKAAINPITTHTFVDGVAWRIGRVTVGTGLTGFTKTVGANGARLRLTYLTCQGTAGGLLVTAGGITLDIKQVEVENGYGIGSAGMAGALDAGVGAINITGTGIGVGTIAGGAEIDAKIGCIDDAGAGTAIFIGNVASTINVVCSRIDCNTAYNVAAAGTLNLHCSSLTGARVGAGTINLVASGVGVENTPIGQTVAAVGSFTDLAGTFKEYVSIPIEWALDGTTPPDAAQVLINSRKIVVRQFQGITANQDVLIPWAIPHDLSGAIIKFRVRGYVSDATAPGAGETAIFTLAGTSIGGSENLNKALGAAVSATFTADATYVQYDRWTTTWSGDVTITDLLADEDTHLQLIRDQGSDTYVQKIGVAWLDIEYTRSVSN